MEKKKERNIPGSVRWFIGFLCVMGMLGLISRQLYTSKLALVSTEEFKHRPITHTVKCSGTAECDSLRPLFLPKDVLADCVYVRQGDRIEKGDALLKLSAESLKARYDKLTDEINNTIEQGEGFKSQDEAPVFTESGLRIISVYKKTGDTVEAGDELAVIDEEHLLRYINSLEAERNKDIITRNAMIDKMNSAEGTDDGMPLSEVSPEQIDTLAISIDEQQKKIDRCAAILQSGCIIRADTDGTVTACDAKAGQLTTENALMVISGSAEPDAGIKRMREELERIGALMDSEGMVYSEYSGTAQRVDISAGTATGENAALFIADNSEGGLYFSGDIDEKDAKRLSVGDSVKLSFRNGRMTTENAVIRSVIKHENSYHLEIPLSEDMFERGSDLTCGEIGEMTTSGNTPDEYYCISKEAVHGTGAQRYVYALEQTEGFFGPEYHAVRHYLNITDENDTFVGASSTGLAEGTSVIVTSNRTLTDGARVRLSAAGTQTEEAKQQEKTLL